MCTICARTTAHYDKAQELLYTSKDVVFLPSDATSGRTVVYVLVVYSALSKISPSSTAQLTKQQTQQMRDWRMTYEVWSKCSIEDCAKHEHQRQSVYSADKSLCPGTAYNNAFGFLEDRRR